MRSHHFTFELHHALFIRAHTTRVPQTSKEVTRHMRLKVAFSIPAYHVVTSGGKPILLIAGAMKANPVCFPSSGKSLRCHKA